MGIRMMVDQETEAMKPRSRLPQQRNRSIKNPKSIKMTTNQRQSPEYVVSSIGTLCLTSSKIKWVRSDLVRLAFYVLYAKSRQLITVTTMECLVTFSTFYLRAYIYPTQCPYTNRETFFCYLNRPTSSQDDHIHLKYYMAEYNGNAGNCESYKKDCPKSVLDLFTVERWPDYNK